MSYTVAVYSHQYAIVRYCYIAETWTEMEDTLWRHTCDCLCDALWESSYSGPTDDPFPIVTRQGCMHKRSAYRIPWILTDAGEKITMDSERVEDEFLDKDSILRWMKQKGAAI